MERRPTFARPRPGRQGAGSWVLAVAAVSVLAGTALAQPRSPFAAWAADVAAPSAVAARSLVGRAVTIDTPAGPLADVGRPLSPSLDGAIPLVRADAAAAVRRGGRGTIVAVIDGGVDFTHPAFRDETGGSRIAWYLDMTLPSRGSPSDVDDLGFALFDGADLDRAAADPAAPRPTGDPTGHGTHVASIAAGSAGAYPGVAPAADIVVVRADRLPGGRFDEADIAAALRFVFGVAGRAGRPCVANVSLGGQLGAHDGTSALERAIDELTLEGPTGRAVVVAAGNEGSRAVHAVLEPTREREDSATLVVPSNSPLTAGARATAVVDLWSAPDRTFSVRVVLPDGTAADTSLEGPAIERDLGGGAALRVQIAVEPAPDSRRLEALVALAGGDDGAVPAGSYRIGVRGDGPVDAYLSAETAVSLFPFRLAGDVRAEGTLSIPATARGAIAVGAMVGRTGWTNHLGEWLEDPSVVTGQVAAFSALGPTADGRFKPDLLAPGMWVLSARAAGLDLPRGPGGRTASGPDPAFAAASGTSMAAPFVAGAVALVFEAEPDLSTRQLVSRLRASGDGRGGWDARSGFGLVDVLDALSDPPPAAAGEQVRTVLSIARPAMDDRAGRRTEIAVALRTKGGLVRSAEGAGLGLGASLSASPLAAGPVAAWTVAADGLLPGTCAALSARARKAAPATGEVCVSGGEGAGCAAAAPTRGVPRFAPALVLALVAAAAATRRRSRGESRATWWPFVAASLAINVALAPMLALILPDAAPGGRNPSIAVALMDEARRPPPVDVAVRVPPAASPAPSAAPAPVAAPEQPVEAPRPRRERRVATGAGAPVAVEAAPGGEASTDGISPSPVPIHEPAGFPEPAGGLAGGLAAGSAAPTSGEGRPDAAPAAPDPCLAAAAEVRARIDASKTYPPLARRRRTGGTAVVAFDLDSSGAVRAASIAESSGSDVLDEAALDAVRSAAPFPASRCSYSLPVQFRIEGR